jgi:hypothetical protein
MHNPKMKLKCTIAPAQKPRTVIRGPPNEHNVEEQKGNLRNDERVNNRGRKLNIVPHAIDPAQDNRIFKQDDKE